MFVSLLVVFTRFENWGYYLLRIEYCNPNKPPEVFPYFKKHMNMSNSNSNVPVNPFQIQARFTALIYIFFLGFYMRIRIKYPYLA